MKIKYVVIAVVIAFIFIPIGMSINYQNVSISYEEQISAATSFIDTSTQRRHDGIIQLVQVVERFAEHETGVVSKIAEARRQATSGNVEEALASINVIKEAYPTLATESQFNHLSNEISSMENQIKRARDNRTEFIRDYNRYVRVFPNRFFLNIMGYQVQNYNYFEASEEDKKPITNMFSK